MNPQMLNKNTHIICLLLGILSMSSSFALPSDRDQMLYITADSAEMNYKTGISTYQGNVKLDQGTTKLRSENMTIVSKELQFNELERIIAQGKTAYYETKPEPEDPLLVGRAKTIIYKPKDGSLELHDHAVAQQKNNVIKGARIDYDINKRHVRSSGSKQQRTTIFIDPDGTPHSMSSSNKNPNTNHQNHDQKSQS